ncbi:MAG: zinc finger protein [Candidatus Micrarchaeia archaeon]
MTSPYEVIAFTALLAAFGYFFPQLLFALYFESWTVPVLTVVGLNLMAYWLLIPSFRYRATCAKCGEINRWSAQACSACGNPFPPETSPYEVIAFSIMIFAFGWSLSQLLALFQLTAITLIGITVPALLVMSAWLLLPNFKHRRICGECGAINWRESKKCFSCGSKFD